MAIQNSALPAKSPRRWQARLKTKAVSLAIGISVLPIVIIGAAEFWLASEALKREALEDQEESALLLADGFSRFMADRHGDIEMIANLPILNDAETATATSLSEKQKILERFISAYGVYDSIVFADLRGQPVLQVGLPDVNNYSNVDYFKAALATKKTVITPPKRAGSTGNYSIFIATPVSDATTGNVIGVVHTRIPETKLEEVFIQDNPVLQQREHLFIDNNGIIFAAVNREVMGKAVGEAFPALGAFAGKKLGTTNVAAPDGTDLLATFARIPAQPGVPDLNWSVVLAQDLKILHDTQQQLLLLDLGITLATVVIAGTIAALLADRLTKPLLAATDTLQQLGQGNLDARLAVDSRDELAVLGNSINGMADQVQALMQQKAAETQQAHLLKEITVRMAQSTELQNVLKVAVEDIRQALQTDRVLISRCDAAGKTTVIEESVLPTLPCALSTQVYGAWITEGDIDRYQQGQIQAISDVHEASLSEQQLKHFEGLSAKAVLIAPIRVNAQLFGLLIAHHCTESRVWQPPEIAVFSQLAAQIGLACNQVLLLEHTKTAHGEVKHLSQNQRQQWDLLQSQISRFTSQMDSVVKGDITVQSDLTGELSGIAERFNTIINHLRQVVVQTKKATLQINASAHRGEQVLHHFAKTLIYQTEQITQSLNAVEQINRSLHIVVQQARQIIEVVGQASHLVEVGVESLDCIKHNSAALPKMAEKMTQKVNRLNESCRQISAATALINQVTLQGNLLAVNAGLEASPIHGEKQMLVVVAQEISELAKRLSGTTEAIETDLREVQRDTSGLVHEINQDMTTQEIQLTHLVENTRQNLQQMLELCYQVEQLAQPIASQIETHLQALQTVSATLQDVIRAFERTTHNTDHISQAFQQITVANRQLEDTVGVFKAGAEVIPLQTAWEDQVN